ncbi:MAG: hypothetical protein NC213_09060 [Acetobacter sp.]|nr:hypothetical protein [Bacteroides sp.]MCM1341878.1 hypothetical protein [Acetobacter sp.]MCM1433175.1 hypothetical protein [Clostridiales bacterium]
MSKVTDTMTLCAAKGNEKKYAFAQSQQIRMQTGYVGYLRGDFGRNGSEFYSTWMDEIKDHKTPEFQSEFDDVINALRDDPKYRGILRNLDDMKLLCSTRPQSYIKFDNLPDAFVFRADTDNYAYLIKCQTHKGDYNFYVTAFDKDCLDRHIKNAEKGIKFVDSRYKKLFTIPDGDKIQITFYDGTKELRTCRYIDEYHTEIGEHLYHICQFAELMENNGNSVIPMRSSLPEQCFVYVDTTNEIGLVKKGEKGYSVSSYTVEDPEKNKELVKYLNDKLNISDVQYSAMTAGSMFGWKDPCANPDNYDKNGVCTKTGRKFDNIAR